MTTCFKVRARRFDSIGFDTPAGKMPFLYDNECPQRDTKRLKKEMPLLVKNCPVTHRQLLDLLYTLDFDGKSSSLHQPPKVLPPEIAARVMSFLTVESVQASRVRPVCSSTHDLVHPLSESLSEGETTWWLTQQGSMPGGKGRQYIQYKLSHTLCRLRTVSLKIPPLPLGPLSVREFYLETFCVERGWFKISPNYLVANKVGWQTFDLPNGGCDVDEVRVVCLRNQMAEFLEGLDMDMIRKRGFEADIRRFSSVGFFSIRFE